MRQVSCPRCRTVLGEREQLAGKIIGCPSCAVQYRIPAAEGEYALEPTADIYSDSASESSRSTDEPWQEVWKAGSSKNFGETQPAADASALVVSAYSWMLVILCTFWLLIATFLTVVGSWPLGWSGYFGVLIAGVAALCILFVPGAHDAKKAAEQFPEFPTPSSLMGRDEAAVGLAGLIAYGCTTARAFRWKMDMLRAGSGMLASFLLEIFSWLMVLGGRAGAAVGGALMPTGGPAAWSARILCARSLIAGYRTLYRQGVFTLIDLKRAVRGVLPSDTRVIWCISEAGGHIYTFRRDEDSIAIRRIDQESEVEAPSTLLNELEFTQTGGFTGLRWRIPRPNGGTTLLNASICESAKRLLQAWRAGLKTGEDLSGAVGTSKLALVSLFSPVLMVSIPLVGMNLLPKDAPQAFFTAVAAFAVLLGPMLGIICGHASRVLCRRNPLLRGGGIAKAGLYVNYFIAFVAGLVVLFSRG